MTRAGRIYEIMFKISRFQNNTKISTMWGSVFDTKDIYETYYMLGLLNDEVKKLEEEFIKKKISPHASEEMIKDMYKLIGFPNFGATVGNINGGAINAIKPTTLASLAAFSQSFGENEIEVKFDIKEDLHAMKEALNDIEDLELKNFMSSIIQILQKSNTINRINGAKGLEEMFKLLFCKINSNLDAMGNTPDSYKESFIKAYSKVKKGLNEAQYLLGSPDKFNKIIDLLGNIG